MEENNLDRKFPSKQVPVQTINCIPPQ
ncbi:unnamed protein product, partial [Rotaria sp. Silwood1]